MSKNNIHKYKILILDFGSQYTQLIARRVREIGVYCEIMPWDADVHQIEEFAANGVILSGGPNSVSEDESPKVPETVFKAGLPALGICYGMQAMALQLGGKVSRSNHREYGHAEVEVVDSSSFLAKAFSKNKKEKKLDVWMSHGDKVTKLPKGFKAIGKSKNSEYAAIANVEAKLYGLQFHPEVTHTQHGKEVLEHFIVDICGCKKLWTSSSIIDDAIEAIKAQVGDDEVVLGLSGGVDSSVTAMLLQRAIGDKLTCVFVDNGLLRLNEPEQVREIYGDQYGLKIISVDARRKFLKALRGVTDPEKKRRVIGGVFIDVFDEEASKLKNARWLAQGTIYPDVIESAGANTKKAHVIKSHHNVGGLPEKMNLKLIEPLRELFKDEVRRVGLELGLPYEMLYRHPFPGPGLGVRVLGEVKQEYCDILRKADAIFIEELHKAGLYHTVSQALAVFLPVKSVGVMGDGRIYDWVIALRAVETVDFMTAHWAHLPYDFLAGVSNRIINEVEGITRVVYDISGKPPATIEWE
jgi:GMP synthase (glutamine-hydrolysing)